MEVNESHLAVVFSLYLAPGILFLQLQLQVRTKVFKFVRRPVSLQNEHKKDAHLFGSGVND